MDTLLFVIKLSLLGIYFYQMPFQESHNKMLHEFATTEKFRTEENMTNLISVGRGLRYPYIHRSISWRCHHDNTQQVKPSFYDEQSLRVEPTG